MFSIEILVVKKFTEVIHYNDKSRSKNQSKYDKSSHKLFVIIIFVNQKSMVNLHYSGKKIKQLKNLIEEKFIQYYRNIIENIIFLILITILSYLKLGITFENS